MTGHVDGEALRTGNVDVVVRQVHAVAGFLCTQRLDGGEHGLHARLIGHALQEGGTDQKRFDPLLHDLGQHLLWIGNGFGTHWGCSQSRSSCLTGNPFRSNEYMSMLLKPVIARISPAARIRYALLLATVVQVRRRELDMSVERAAALSGFALSEWYALESGWVPDRDSLLSAIAQTLELSRVKISFLAEVGRYHQEALD